MGFQEEATLNDDSDSRRESSDRDVDKTARDIEFIFRSKTLGIEASLENDQEKFLEKEKFDEIVRTS